MTTGWRQLAAHGGSVTAVGERAWQLRLDPAEDKRRPAYAVAQIDDYGGRRRRDYPWRPGTRLRLRARFRRPAAQSSGTAGFGFWNAPFGDPTVRRPAIPQAVWFFLAGPPNDLPFAPGDPGRGWFAATLDAGRPSAWGLAPLAPFFLLANQVPLWRRRLWPWLQRQLGIAYAALPADPTVWHHYALEWRPAGCRFLVDDQAVLESPFSPRGPLGLVAWIDNQYLIARPTGRFGAGTTAVTAPESLEISHLGVEKWLT